MCNQKKRLEDDGEEGVLKSGSSLFYEEETEG